MVADLRKSNEKLINVMNDTLKDFTSEVIDPYAVENMDENQFRLLKNFVLLVRAVNEHTTETTKFLINMDEKLNRLLKSIK